MKFGELLAIVDHEPVFETGLLLSGDREPADARRQLSRWVARGWLYRLRRGLYALAPPHAKTRPHPFLIANQLVRGSYVSLQSALAARAGAVRTAEAGDLGQAGGGHAPSCNGLIPKAGTSMT